MVLFPTKGAKMSLSTILRFNLRGIVHWMKVNGSNLLSNVVRRDYKPVMLFPYNLSIILKGIFNG